MRDRSPKIDQHHSLDHQECKRCLVDVIVLSRQRPYRLSDDPTLLWVNLGFTTMVLPRQNVGWHLFRSVFRNKPVWKLLLVVRAGLVSEGSGREKSYSHLSQQCSIFWTFPSGKRQQDYLASASGLLLHAILTCWPSDYELRQ